MKFIHVSDTHLGIRPFKLVEREFDFYRAFSKMIDDALNCDFVIHSGDLFDRGRPSIQTIIFTIEQLKRLKEKGIPFFAIPGSHDISVEGAFISVLDKIGLLKNLASKRYHKQNGDKILINGEKFGEVYICGLAGIRGRIHETYRRIIANPNGSYNIFLFHHIVSSIKDANVFSDIPMSLLPKGFDYYGGGHWHSHEILNYGNGKVVYPGSIEFTELSEYDESKKKGYCIVEDGKIKFVETNTRPIRVVELNCTSMSASEVTKKCCELIPDEKDAIFVIKLKGRLREGVKGEIDRNLINEVSKQKGLLFTKIYLSELQNPINSNYIEVKKKSLSEIEEEYLLKQNYSREIIDAAKEIIRILGSELSGNELELAKKKVISILEGLK